MLCFNSRSWMVFGSGDNNRPRVLHVATKSFDMNLEPFSVSSSAKIPKFAAQCSGKVRAAVVFSSK